jgi:ribonuclease HI
MAKPKRKFYVVWEGHQPGVYDTWPEAEKQVNGYSRPKYKSFMNREAAEAAFRGNYWNYAGKDTTTNTKSLEDLVAFGVQLDAIAVDAACSGTPGPMEYRGIHIRDRNQLFHAGPYEDGTNNVGEFLAIVHALALLKKQGKPDLPIYSDSYNARSWVRKKTCRTKLQMTGRNGPIFNLLTRAVRWLHDNEVTNPILTWETEQWGEIPADFGRK